MAICFTRSSVRMERGDDRSSEETDADGEAAVERAVCDG